MNICQPYLQFLALFLLGPRTKSPVRVCKGTAKEEMTSVAQASATHGGARSDPVDWLRGSPFTGDELRFRPDSSHPCFSGLTFSTAEGGFPRRGQWGRFGACPVAPGQRWEGSWLCSDPN